MSSARLHEFAAVDRSADPEAFARYLDEVTQTTGLLHLKKQTYAMMALRPGDHALDVGCGVGDDVRAMAALVAPGGRAVGIDRSHHLIGVAKERSPAGDVSSEYRVGLAERLEFDDESFHAVRAERTLQHVADAGGAVAEMIRVLRPGGRLVCFEPDWDLQAFDTHDVELMRRICTFRSGQMASGGVGRSLRGYFLAGGLSDVEFVPIAGVLTDLRVAEAVMGLRATVDGARERGVVTSEEAAGWWAEMESANRAGRFLAVSVAFLVSGRKPPA